MAINDGFYWYKNVLKKQLKLALRIYLSLAIVLSPIFLMNAANAANVGGWSLGGGVAQGASTVYQGTKNVIINGADYIKKGTAKITPNAAQVAKVLRGGAAGYALSIAVEQLIGSVDWVLDPANNAILYNQPSDPTQPSNSAPILYYSQSYPERYATLDAAINAAIERWNKETNAWGIITGIRSVTKPYPEQYNVDVIYKNYPNWFAPLYINTTVNPNYDPEATDEQKSIPLETVAQQVISNAQGGDTNAQVATMAAAADIVAEAEADDAKARPIAQQLESTAKTTPADEAAAEKANEATGTQTQNPAKPDTTDLTLEFPIFCNWAPTVCEAAQVVISFPQTLTNWWETGKQKAESWASSIAESWAAAKDWATSEPQEEPQNTDIEDLNIDADEVNLTASNTCPQDSISFSVMGKSVTLDMPYQPVCDALNFFKPAVLLVGAVASVYIVAGVRTKEEDEV